MKPTRIDTLRLGEFPNLLFVLIRTDEGIVGSVNLPNALVQESVRAYYTGWYKELVTRLSEISDGHISPPDLHLRPDARLVLSERSHTRVDAIRTRVLADGR
jgi:hypothetical protein